jgi:hypothetical protein
VEWTEPVRERIERIMAGLDAARLQVMSGGDAARAAGDAFVRLPVLSPAAITERREELPPLDPGFERSRPQPQPAAQPQRTRVRPQWIAIAVFVGIMAGIVAWLGLVSYRNRESTDAVTGTTRAFFDLTQRSTLPVPTTTALPPRDTVVGLVHTDPAPDPAVTETVTAVGDVLGRPAQLVAVRAATPADAAAAVSQLRRQGVAGVIVDVEPTAVDPAVTAAGADLAVCATTTPGPLTAGATVMLATARHCTNVLLLAVLAADDSDAALVADALRQIGSERRVGCETFEHCRRLVERGQSIMYTPDGRPLRLSPSADPPR